MTRFEVNRMAQQLMSSERKLGTTVSMLMEVFVRFGEAQQAFNESLDARDTWYDTMHNSQQLQKEMIDKIVESIAMLQAACQQTQLMVHHNNERMDKLITKMEAYFGTTGLDYDN